MLIAREQNAGERSAWRVTVARLDPAQIIVLDETSTPPRLTSHRALALAGMGPSLQFPGALDRDAFETYVEQLLVPTLHAGQVVSWDNLSVHTSLRARLLIEAAGCQALPTPRYSPDCNPIESAFAKLKTALRRAEARSFEDLVTATGTAMATITPEDARHFFADAGYQLPRQPL